MLLSSFRQLLLISVIIALPTFSYGLSPENMEKFKKDCNMYWMKDSEKVTDKVEYKNFGEKYCSCMSTHPLDSDTDMRNSAKVCMGQTLLHITMENLEEDPGLSALNAAKIEEECIKVWDFIGTALVGDKKGQNAGYCKCAAPKLNDMNAKRDDMTDDDWKSTINKIAKDCL